MVDAKDRLIRDLRGLVMSVQGGESFSQLKRDYAEFYEADLGRVCVAAGFHSLEDLVQKHPYEFRVANGRVVATIKAESSHISKLVAQQKKKKRPARFSASRPIRQFSSPHSNRTYYPPPRHLVKSQPLMSKSPKVERKIAPLMSVKPPQLPTMSRIIDTSRVKNIINNNYLVQNEQGPKTVCRIPPMPEQRFEEGDFFTDVPAISEAVPVIQKIKPTENKLSADTALNEKVKKLEISNVEPPPNKCDVHVQLRETCIALGYKEPEMQVVSHCINGREFYSCVVEAAGKHFSSDYAYEDRKTATDIAVSRAVTTLTPLVNELKVEKKVNHTELDDFLKYLRETLTKKKAGVWVRHVATLYEKASKKEAPEGWREAMESCPDFNVFDTFGGDIVALRSKEEPLPEVQKKVQNTNSTSTPYKPNIALPSLEVSPMVQSKRRFPELKIPSEGQIDVHILYFPTHNSVIVRLIDDDAINLYNETMTNLELELMEKYVVVEKPIVGEYYAVQLNEIIVRAVLEKIEPDGKATIYAIDEGERETVNLDQIYRLEDEYFKLPPQALRFWLDGLNNFPDRVELVNSLDALTRGSFVAILKKSHPPDEHECRGVIDLYDTSVTPNRLLNLHLMENAVKELSPIFQNSTNDRYELVLTDVENNKVFLQSNDNGMDAITSLTDYVASKIDLAQYKVKKMLFEETYFVISRKTGKFRRVKIEGFGDITEVFFIDHGYLAEIDRNDLYSLPNKILLDAAPQAAKAILNEVETLTPAMTLFIKENIVGKTVMVWLKKDKCTNLPCVEIYWREPKNNLLQNLKKTLKNLNSLIDIAVAPTTTGLPNQTIPALNSMLFVTVALSVNPSSFKIRLKEHKDIFFNLMDSLQKEGFDGIPKPEPKCLKTGEYFVVKQDSNWFRGKLDIIFDDDKFSLTLIDIGTIVFVSLGEIRELPLKFRKHAALLYQATLAGVTPVMGDWLPADCVSFQDSVSEKELVAVLKDIRFLEDGSHALAVTLIDTTDPDKDVYINEQLVKDGIAKPSL